MLIYIGQGFRPGIPARDLTDEEVRRYGGEKALLATGLYAKPETTKARRGSSSNKALAGPSADKGAEEGD